MKTKNLHPLVSPSQGRPGVDPIKNPVTRLRRAIRSVNLLLNPDEGARRPDDVEAAAIYIAEAVAALREVQIAEREDRTPRYIKWLRERLAGQFQGRELEDIARELRPLVPQALRKEFKLELGWPSISVISRQRSFIKKARIRG